MRPRLPAWLAVVASVVVHFIAAAVLVQTMTPEPISTEETVKAKFAVSALRVPSQRVRDTEPEGDATNAVEDPGESVGVESIPSSRARPLELEAAAASAISPGGLLLADVLPADAPIEPTAPKLTNLPATAPTVKAADQVAVSGTRVAALLPQSQTTPSHEPDADAIADTQPLIRKTEASQPTDIALAAVDAAPELVGASTALPAVVEATTVPASEPAEPVAVGGIEVAALAPQIQDAPSRELDAGRMVAAAVVGRPASVALDVVDAVSSPLTAAAASPPMVRAADAPLIRVDVASDGARPIAPADPPSTAIRAAPNSAAGLQVATLEQQRVNIAPTASVAERPAEVRPSTRTVESQSSSGAEIDATSTAGQLVVTAAQTDDVEPRLQSGTPPTLALAAASSVSNALASAILREERPAIIRPRTEPMETVSSSGQSATAVSYSAVAASVPQHVADVPATRARQAWEGDASTGLSEHSLFAIQSFMHAVNTSSEGGVRDGIGAALANFPCSRLQAAYLPETGGLEVRGHVPNATLRSIVVEFLAESVGASIPVGGSLMVVPEPQCDVLDRIDHLGLPQSADQANDPLVIGEAAQADILQFEEGANVSFRLRAADYDSYVYLDFFSVDGAVLHIIPSEHIRRNFQPPDAEFVVGGGDEGSIRMIAAPPFGQDVAVLLATTRPLYEGVRPPVEDAVTYLDWLGNRLRGLRQSDPEFRGEWAYLFIITGPSGSFAQ